MKAKFLIRWATVLGLATAGWFGQNFPALALSPQQIQEKLQLIPVFTIAENDQPLVFQPKPEDKGTFIFFISPTEATKVLDQLKQKNPDKPLKLLPLSLWDMYKAFKENKSKPEVPAISLYPSTSQVSAAQGIVGGQEKFVGIPLFVATIKVKASEQDGGGEQEIYLPAEDANNKQVIPFFFEKESVQKIIDDLKKSQPAQANNLNIRVVPLEGLLADFETQDPKKDPIEEGMVIVPSQESIQFIQNAQKNRASQPAPAPSPTPEKK